MPEPKAKVLYYAVLNFGPSWQMTAASDGSTKTGVPIYSSSAPPTAEDVAKIMQYFNSQNPDVDQIPNLKID